MARRRTRKSSKRRASKGGKIITFRTKKGKIIRFRAKH